MTPTELRKILIPIHKIAREGWSAVLKETMAERDAALERVKGLEARVSELEAEQ